MIIEEEEEEEEGRMKKSSRKSDNYECCMCGDLGLSHHLFRCSLCHFRSQHRYCSNLYPSAETYRVCNWCLSHTQTDDAQVGSATPTTTYNDNSNSPDQGHPDNHHHHIIINKTTTTTTTTMAAANNDKIINWKRQYPKPKVLSKGGAAKSHSPNRNSLQHIPIIKKARSPECRSPSSGRKRNTDVNMPQALNKDQEIRPSKSKLIMRRHYAKSSDEEMLMLMLIPSSSSSSSITNMKNSTSCSGSPSISGSVMNPPVVRNKYKVRRYKLLDEVSY